jgi:glycosyltransferase involved in cell wall biosynthesis
VAAEEDQQRKLRVLTLVDGLPAAGGGETFAALVAAHLDARRFESHLCVTRWSDALASRPSSRDALRELDAAGVSFLGLRRASRARIDAWRPLLAFLRLRRIDVIHAHKFGSNAWGSVIGRLTRVPVVVAHEHSWSFEDDGLRRFIDSHVIGRLADRVIAVSGEDRRRMIELEGMDPAKVALIPTGIEIPRREGCKDVRVELGIGPEQPVVGIVGGLRPEKSLDVLVEAVCPLMSDFPNLRVLICGEGGERSKLEALVSEYGLRDVVSFLGWRADVADVIDAFDIAVCSSSREGSPLSVLEYMDAAKPVVATRVGGIPGLVDDGVSGTLVGPEDPGELSASLRRLLVDPALGKEMGAKGRARRRRDFDLDEIVRQIENLYIGIYEAKRTA